MQNTDEALTEMRMKPPGDLIVDTGHRIDHSEGRAALGEKEGVGHKKRNYRNMYGSRVSSNVSIKKFDTFLPDSL